MRLAEAFNASLQRRELVGGELVGPSGLDATDPELGGEVMNTGVKTTRGTLGMLAWFLLLVPAVGLMAACGNEPAGSVSFAEPRDGERVESPFTVRMTASGVRVEPASAGINNGAGHHHIIVDSDLPLPGSPVPSDEQHRHFGKGQTETVLDLPVGEHTLRLSFADGAHHPLDPAVTDTIKITVPERRAVSFVEPRDGDSVVSPFTVKMTASGVKVEPASAGINKGAGHHHIIVDSDLPLPGRPVPSDEQHRHFGKGQTETVLDLPVGEHTLRLSFADGAHHPLDPAVTDTIKITVTERRAVSFVEPRDDDSVVSPFTVKMTASGVKVEPASAGINKGAGHHHIIVDSDLPLPGRPVPSDEQHRHFGKGQTETVLDLPVGEHTLRLSFADGTHHPLDPAVTDTIKITVVESAAQSSDVSD